MRLKLTTELETYNYLLLKKIQKKVIVKQLFLFVFEQEKK